MLMFSLVRLLTAAQASSTSRCLGLEVCLGKTAGTELDCPVDEGLMITLNDYTNQEALKH